MPTPDLSWNLEAAYAGINWTSTLATHGLGAVLPGFLCGINAAICIEIGIGNGFLTDVLARGLTAAGRPDRLLLTCDIQAVSCQFAMNILARYDALSSEVFCADSRMLDWQAELKRHGAIAADLSSVDGDHRYEACKHDLLTVGRATRPGGIIVAHDCWQLEPGVVQAVAEFCEETGASRLMLPAIDGGAYPAALIQMPL